jgi:pyruvate/oxaloacetate carboxyltransferase
LEENCKGASKPQVVSSSITSGGGSRMDHMDKLPKKPVKITDTTFRDGHQSTLATRMRTEDMIPVAKELDDIGFYSLEVWGGATFDVTHRFLGEDPWERVRTLKKLMPKTPFQMLLRGQNLVAYRNHPDDLVEAFIEKSAEVGIDIFRCFDAVNDERNFETAFKVIKRMKKHIQGTICYSLTQRRMGGAVYNLDYYLKKAKILADMGSDSLCIKDMAGILAPYDVYELVKALKETVKIPIQLHTHYTSGMGSMTYLKAVEAGVDVIDTALAPFALRSSQPAVEPIVVTLEGTPWDTGLDLARLLKLDEYLETIAPKYRDFLDTTKMAVIDTGVLKHQIPGGMISNMVSQLKQQKAVHRLEEVYAELPKTREDLGCPPLVTPTSQIVGVQAVLNVLFGRYKMVSRETQDLAYGLYGKTPVPIKDEIRRLILKGYAKGQEPITCRPADLIPAELEKAKEETKDLAKDICDTLIYALYPKTGVEFLKWKYGIEPLPDKVKPKTLEDIKKEDEAISKAKTEVKQKTA